MCAAGAKLSSMMRSFLRKTEAWLFLQQDLMASRVWDFELLLQSTSTQKWQLLGFILFLSDVQNLFLTQFYAICFSCINTRIFSINGSNLRFQLTFTSICRRSTSSSGFLTSMFQCFRLINSTLRRLWLCSTFAPFSRSYMCCLRR